MMVMKSMNVTLKCNIYIDVWGWDQMVQPRDSHVYSLNKGLELYGFDINVIGYTISNTITKLNHVVMIYL